jgi:hypothetical protein
VIPVSQRATNRLIRQLDLMGLAEPIGEEALRRYASLFDGPLTPQSVATIRAVTHLGDDHITMVAAALVTDEMDAQVDAAAA